MPTSTPDDPDVEPAGLSTFATIGLLILAIGGLAAVSAWLWAWYQGRQEALLEPDAPIDPDDPDAPIDPEPLQPGPDDPPSPTAGP